MSYIVYIVKNHADELDIETVDSTPTKCWRRATTMWDCSQRALRRHGYRVVKRDLDVILPPPGRPEAPPGGADAS